MYNVGGNGNYWSSSPNSTDNSRNLNFNSTNLNPLNNNNRANGFSVRPARIRHLMQLFLSVQDASHPRAPFLPLADVLI